jgi:hypothetical protein
MAFADRAHALARGSIALAARTCEPDLLLRLEYANLAVAGHAPAILRTVVGY